MQDGPVDFLGQTIVSGDTVVYPNRQGSSLWMNKARVVGFKKIKDADPESPVERLRSPSFSLKVKRVTDGITKTLTCLDRVVVITGVLRTDNMMAAE